MLLAILLIVILIVSVTINVLLYKALKNQLNKINLYEVWIGEYDSWCDDVRNMVRSTYLKMKTVDEKGLFFKDDDVGFVFTEMLFLLKKLNDKIEK
jgi:hypothetical protein